MKPYYEHAGITIYNGNCEEILPSLSCVDLILTDPPYGVSFRGAEWDKEVPEFATKLPSMCKKVAIIMGTTAIFEFPSPKWIACWARPASSSRSKVGGFSHWSPILLYGDCTMSVDFASFHAIQHSYGKEGIGHPSPKPEIVMRWLIGQLSLKTDIIIDPYMGSGTTLRAAKDLNRKATGIELEERYCEIAANRMSQEVLAL